jgi:integrase
MHSVKGKRDRAILAVLLGCGLRRRELIDLTFDHIQRREDHWAIVDLVGKGGHIRTVPMPNWVKQTIDDWLTVADVVHGKIFRCVCREGVVWGTEITERVVWHVVKEYAKRLGVSKLAPHDLRKRKESSPEPGTASRIESGDAPDENHFTMSRADDWGYNGALWKSKRRFRLMHSLESWAMKT